MPDPAPHGLPSVWAGAPYEGPVRQAVVRFKDRGRTDVAAHLGEALAAAVRAAWRADPTSEVWLVPVPTATTAARVRGGCRTTLLARHAARAGVADGVRVSVVPALAVTRGRADSVGRSAADRARLARGAFAVRPDLRRRATRSAESRLVVVDDVVTTGATLQAACAALAGAGVSEGFDGAGLACAVVAATLRQRRGQGRVVRGRPTADFGADLT